MMYLQQIHNRIHVQVSKRLREILSQQEHTPNARPSEQDRQKHNRTSKTKNTSQTKGYCATKPHRNATAKIQPTPQRCVSKTIESLPKQNATAWEITQLIRQRNKKKLEKDDEKQRKSDQSDMRPLRK